MTQVLKDFAIDLIESGVGAAAAAVLALQFDSATPQLVAYAALAGFITGVLAAARRRLEAARKPA
jgi:hypothetical protein